MARLGKKILSAFIDVGEDKKEDNEPAVSPKVERTVVAPAAQRSTGTPADPRFADYFDKLFSDANIPGPDYYEFVRMTGAMLAIADERSRYSAAFAGLQVQGLDKEKLLSTANEYLRVLTTDADHFQKTVEAALQEKVNSRSAEAEEKSRRIQALSQEILELQQQISAMQSEIAESKEKLTASSSGYTAECERRKQQIQYDIEKIKLYIQ
ncbi:hypothetical protein [Puia dinghuensis]|uniref:Uncharacterized protein n=1 Tax=Puia dinghuensis TaxID=1792502 RepID=A0A8J2UGQ1_9BACT|nr:hypothetical protein [Puia dinghuensis]GGB13064.1 hypothetical protein GCM10011511_40890 [Puia dinghuensis]